MKTVAFEIKRDLTEEESVAFDIVSKLQKAGYEALVAGGAVRDELLGLPAYDIDIATSAKPQEIKALFPQGNTRGEAFGVYAVKVNSFEFEIATFRQDLGIKDHRRPESVVYTNAENDAKRRDFTINGLFYDPIKKQIIDYVDGLTDLEYRKIRFIGNPEDRINEDYLRMLRAIRFATRLNFVIEENSKNAIRNNARKITEISPERIREELSKTLILDRRDWAIVELDELGLLNEVLPELEATKNVSQPPEFHSEGSVWIHTLLALKNIKKDPSEELVWAVLLHDIAKPETQGFRSEAGKSSITFFDHDIRSAQKAKMILERLRFSHHFIDAVTWAISQHMRIVNAFRGMSERKQKKIFCDPNIDLLLDLTWADLSASLRPNYKPEMNLYYDALKKKEDFERLSESEKKTIKKFDLITGNDIIQILGFEPGPEVGLVKSEIERAYLNGEINNRKDALKMLEKYRK